MAKCLFIKWIEKVKWQLGAKFYIFFRFIKNNLIRQVFIKKEITIK